MRIQKEVGVPRNRKVVNGESVKGFRRLDLSRRDTCAAKLGETIRNEEDEDDQEAITRSLDLKVPEERVGAEEVQRLIDDITQLVIHCGNSWVFEEDANTGIKYLQQARVRATWS